MADKLETVDDLRHRFVYKGDGRLDTYRILQNDGPLCGDCDDFAVTALWLAEGKSMKNFWKALNLRRAVLWRVKGSGFASHIVLYHRDFGWIDNQYPRWSPTKHHTLRFPVPVTLVAAKLVLGTL